VKAKVRLDHIADVALLHLENGFFKWLDHGIAAKVTQITAIGSRAGILRVGLGHLGKALGIFAHLGQQLLSLGLAFHALQPEDPWPH
jgi:hypothetical protein